MPLSSFLFRAFVVARFWTLALVLLFGVCGHTLDQQAADLACLQSRGRVVPVAQQQEAPSVFDLSVLSCDLGVSQGVVASPRSNTGAEVQAPYSVTPAMKTISRFRWASERSGACKTGSIPIREILTSKLEFAELRFAL